MSKLAVPEMDLCIYCETELFSDDYENACRECVSEQ